MALAVFADVAVSASSPGPASLARAQSAMAAKYLFYQMPKVDEAYCPYCIIDALAHFATLGLVLPEAVEAAEKLLGHGKGRLDDRFLARVLPTLSFSKKAE